ncbi:MAG TPA: endolytic transglycosylase MltG [Candidatus Binatia bacterium]|jgi:UPF0755 protein|nr:endolytic transglycosylase MltG [Candidatus Binatia bacterium]
MEAVKYFVLTLLFLLLSSLLLFGFVLVFIFSPQQQKPQSVEVKVERGEPFSSVVRNLKDRGVIQNERLFSLWARLWATDRQIHWGLYRFELPLSLQEILDQMRLGRGVFYRVTIREGLTLKEIADLLEKEGVAKRDQFLKDASDPGLLSHAGLAADGFEGYLFPDTYYFTPFVTEREILVTMTTQFRRAFTSEMRLRAREIGLNLHEVVTLASLIEKEAGVDEERPLVSAVFHNRLKKKMLLQSDPTVIYGLKNFSGDLTRKDLQNRNPYNTYRILGLPPAPICSPSFASLMAALYPAPVPYLYFVSKNDGTHLFSVNFNEHDRAVKAYQSKRRPLAKP